MLAISRHAIQEPRPDFLLTVGSGLRLDLTEHALISFHATAGVRLTELYP